MIKKGDVIYYKQRFSPKITMYCKCVSITEDDIGINCWGDWVEDLSLAEKQKIPENITTEDLGYLYNHMPIERCFKIKKNIIELLREI